jgi:methionyl aminopeptidase
VQSSRNHVAAHYCPSPESEETYAEGDVAKIDVGAHVDGWVVDTAATVNVGEVPANQPIIDAARAALEAAIEAARPGVEIRELSARIEQAVRARGFQPVRNLCGHGVGRWTVHQPPPVPNVPDDRRDRLGLGTVVAVEPFATNGRGWVREEGTAEVFRLDGAAGGTEGVDAEVLAAIRGFRGLPFARRQLAAFARARVEESLAALARGHGLTAYAPLVERAGHAVAQAEHPLYLGPGGVEVLTQ